jgi:GNAT superfamily N-acetyltransferase
MNASTYKIFKSSKEYALWSMKEQKFLDILYGNNDLHNETKVICEESDNSLIGFISVKYKVIGKEKRGVIVFLFVDEKYRGTGAGKKLLTAGVNWLKGKRVKEIKCGANAGSYFWPGIPENLNVANFFLKNGFQTTNDVVVDMFQDVTNFVAPSNIYLPLKENTVIIEYANEEYASKISDFVKADFPNWAEYYQESRIKEHPKNFFFAHKGDEIIGVSTLWIGNSNWDMLFENSVGGGGALGVSEKWRGKGVGSAMKCWGTEKIKSSGIKYVWVGWTSSISFYEKLGFKIWRKFIDAKLVL